MKLTHIFTATAIASLVACGGEAPVEDEVNIEAQAEETSEEVNLDEEAQFRMDMIIINNVAAPAQLLINMKASGMSEYISELMVDADNVADKMTNHTNKGLLLGVVGSDVSYIAMHDRHSEAMPYLAVMKKLGDDLGCGYVLDEEMLTKFENSKGSNDSLVDMVYEQYYKFDEYLRTNDRIETAAHVLTGGLVESLFQVTSQLKDAELTDNAKLILYDERNSLDKIIELYTDLEQSEANKEIVEHLQGIRDAFGESSEFSAESLDNLNMSINELREHFVQGSIS